MPYSVEIFKQDIKAGKKALEKDDFENVNVAANRMMMNAFLLGGSQLGLAGFMIRDIVIPVLALKQSTRSGSVSSAKAPLQLLLGKIGDTIASPEEKKPDLWDSYYVSLKSLRLHLLDEHESDAFATERTDFTHEAFMALIKYFEKYSGELVKPNSHLIKSMYLEINRFYQLYGISKEDVQRRAPFILLTWIDDYLAAISNDEKEFAAAVAEVQLPLVKRTVDICGKEQINLDEIMLLTWDMVAEWRDLYMKHSELLRAARQFSRQQLTSKGAEPSFQIPEETKEKMASLVTKGIEDQVRGKK